MSGFTESLIKDRVMKSCSRELFKLQTLVIDTWECRDQWSAKCAQFHQFVPYSLYLMEILVLSIKNECYHSEMMTMMATCIFASREKGAGGGIWTYLIIQDLLKGCLGPHHKFLVGWSVAGCVCLQNAVVKRKLVGHSDLLNQTVQNCHGSRLVKNWEGFQLETFWQKVGESEWKSLIGRIWLLDSNFHQLAIWRVLCGNRLVFHNVSTSLKSKMQKFPITFMLPAVIMS